MELPHLVNVLDNQGTTKGPFGGRVAAWRTVLRNVPCNVQKGSGREVKSDVGVMVVEEYIALSDPNPPWSSGQRLDWQGKILAINDIDPDVAGRGHHAETSLSKASGEG